MEQVFVVLDPDDNSIVSIHKTLLGAYTKAKKINEDRDVCKVYILDFELQN